MENVMKSMHIYIYIYKHVLSGDYSQLGFIIII